MIVSGAWWDFVDVIATHQLGDVLCAEPAPMSKLMRRWARDNSIARQQYVEASRSDPESDLVYQRGDQEPVMLNSECRIQKP
jgi:hypothetical protein